MNLKTDPLTGEKYDADVWYRAGGLWHNIPAERECARREEEDFLARAMRKDASRMARGKRPRGIASRRRSAARYSAFLREDMGRTFAEFLKGGSHV